MAVYKKYSYTNYFRKGGEVQAYGLGLGEANFPLGTTTGTTTNPSNTTNSTTTADTIVNNTDYENHRKSEQKYDQDLHKLTTEAENLINKLFLLFPKEESN